MVHTRKFILLFLVIAVFCSCQPLRKKFTRKRKPQKEEPVYVDFKEYPTSTSKELYSDYHLYVIGWLDEFIQTFEGEANYKRQVRSIGEALYNIEQIMFIFNEEGKEQIKPLYDALIAIQQELSPAMTQVQKNRIVMSVESLRREFNNGFRYIDASKWIRR